MRMLPLTPSHHDILNLPLAVALITSGAWLHAFETGSWFLGLLLPYIGFAVGSIQLFFLTRRFINWLRS
jgi:hypothetical protein